MGEGVVTGWTSDPVAIRAALDDDAARRALPHYGGNKIPMSYLRRFLTHGNAEQSDEQPSYDVAAFIRNM